MQSYRLTTLITLLVMIAAVATKHSEQRTLTIRRQADATDKDHQVTLENETRSIESSNLRSPFIVLMSKSAISVAQLPMIEDGNLTDVYHLVTNPDDYAIAGEENEQETGVEIEREDHQAEGEFDEGVKSNSSRDSHERDEQQMLRSIVVNEIKNSINESLGKSEWQQIGPLVPSVRDREEFWSQTQAAPPVSSVRKEDRHAASSGTGNMSDNERQETRSRIRRRIKRNGNSSSAANSAAEVSISANDGTVAAGNAAVSQQSEYNNDDAQAVRVNRAQESSTAQNVTSALPNNEPERQQQTSPILGSAQGASSWLPTEDDNKTGSAHNFGPFPLASSSLSRANGASSASSEGGVRFCDFDVHMALGYVFVADSTGRIHRFKLPSGTSSSSLAHIHTQTGQRKAATTSDAILNSSAGNDYTSTNTIDAEPNSHLRQQKLDSRRASSNKPNDARGSNNVRAADNDDDDRHHLRQETTRNDDNYAGSAATVKALHANQVDGQSSDGVYVVHRSDGGQHPTISGNEQRLSSAGNGAPTSASATAQQLNMPESFPIDSSDARIIWSRRIKVGAPTQRTSGSSTTKRIKTGQLQQLASQGASPSENELNRHRATAAAVGAQQQANYGSQSARAAVQSEHSESLQMSATGADFFPTQHRPNGMFHRMETKIAVDWLSNLLFVLDKYRLFVVDFDGHNELILIDDFNAITRPIDMKLDPMNNFLFWLQAGRFHNTIYKLDLSVLSMPSATQRLVGNTLKLRRSGTRTLANFYDNKNNNESENGLSNSGAGFDSSDLVALISHHYAHPIITNLPRHITLFTIDHKHSRIYVPLSRALTVADSKVGGQTKEDEQPKRDDAEVFAPSDDTTTHLNSTDSELSFVDNCTVFAGEKSNSRGQILAYNLDGTDVGPLRTAGDSSHINSVDDIDYMTLDTKNNLLYWLTNSGRELFEEYRDGSTIYPAQHNLDGKSYSKLVHFDRFNQPIMVHNPRYSMRKIIQTLASSLSPNRWVRSDGYEQFDENVRASSLNVRQRIGFDTDTTRFSRNAPYIILGVVCLIVITVYLIYTLIFQQMSATVNNVHHNHHNNSIDSESIGESARSDHEHTVRPDALLSPSRWPVPGPSVRSTDTSNFNRDVATSSSGRIGAYDIESSNYDASNAIDEHYRNNSISHGNYCDENQSLDINSPRLADIGAWPTRALDVFNKLYVPVELTQDETLLSITRITMDQLEIERKAPLGEGHFGTVLQGIVKCSAYEKANLINGAQTNMTSGGEQLDQKQRLRLPIVGSSSTSSGHGSSSSTSGEFITANSCTEGLASNDDYLTPRNQLDSVASDYIENADNFALIKDCQSNTEQNDCNKTVSIRVAIKKLKDNASIEEKRDFLQEAKLLANFNHPNIVQLIGICLDRGSTLIVMELMLGGDLIRYMQENTPKSIANDSEELTYDDLLNICLDIVNGCCYLEDLDYIHRDLAARNCLVSSRKREERIVKLADFGLARDIYKDSYYKKLNDSAMPLKWMAPECLIEQKFTKKSDVWSFGVVMWEVMGYCQEKPYGGIEPFFMKEHLESGARLRKPDNCDDDMYRLMHQCWQKEPDHRPTFNECRAILIKLKNGKTTL